MNTKEKELHVYLIKSSVRLLEESINSKTGISEYALSKIEEGIAELRRIQAEAKA